MGVDMATRKGLIAHTLDVEQIRAHIGADSLVYLSLNGLLKATHGIEGAAAQGVPHLANGQSSFCAACFSGRYPIPIPAWLFDDDRDKTVFEL
jgi:amidophosphoribosyltransferase